jgi:hypothetical protein
MAAQTTAPTITHKSWCREHQTDSEGEHCFSGGFEFGAMRPPQTYGLLIPSATYGPLSSSASTLSLLSSSNTAAPPTICG